MSGIVGWLDLEGNPVDRSLVQRRIEEIAWWGHDRQQVWGAGEIALGVAWLNTWESDREPPPDLPVHGRSSGSGCVIVADVRLDGRRELLRMLPDPVSATASDEALILAVYRSWGVQGLFALRGDFSFLLWDLERRRLIGLRDPLGIKPFFYAQLGSALICANALATVRRFPGLSADLRGEAVADYLLFGANRDLATTTFSQISRLPPGHCLIASAGSPGPRIQRYWRPSSPRSPLRRPQQDDVEAYLGLLRRAVGERSTSARSTVFLSGGMDSTTVAALAQEARARWPEAPPLKAFTVIYERLIPDREKDFAAPAAAALGLDWQLFPADEYRLFAGWESTDSLPPEPVDGHMLRLNQDLYRLAAAHGPVAWTGDGGDPALLPSSRAMGELLWRGEWKLAAGYWLDAWRWLRRPPPLGLRSWWSRKRAGRGWREGFPSWLARRFVRAFDLEDRWYQAQLQGPSREEEGDRPEAIRALSDPFWVSFFEARDPGATGIPLEVRSPLFDLRVLEFSLHLPASWCLDKRLLRVAMAGILPEVVRNRPKAPLVAAPHHSFDRSPGELFGRSNVAETGIFEYLEERSFREWLRQGQGQLGQGQLGQSKPGLGQEAIRALGLGFWLVGLAAEEKVRS